MSYWASIPRSAQSTYTIKEVQRLKQVVKRNGVFRNAKNPNFAKILENTCDSATYLFQCTELAKQPKFTSTEKETIDIFGGVMTFMIPAVLHMNNLEEFVEDETEMMLFLLGAISDELHKRVQSLYAHHTLRAETESDSDPD